MTGTSFIGIACNKLYFMKYLMLLGRLLFSWIFIASSFGHFSAEAVAHAAGKGVPMANILVPMSGVLALLGGLSILLGYKAKLGAWLIILFLVPVTLMMHDYWNVTDPMQQMMQRISFNKNMALTGAALWMAYFGAGALSIDAWLVTRHRASPAIVRGFGTKYRGKHVPAH